MKQLGFSTSGELGSPRTMGKNMRPLKNDGELTDLIVSKNSSCNSSSDEEEQLVEDGHTTSYAIDTEPTKVKPDWTNSHSRVYRFDFTYHLCTYLKHDCFGACSLIETQHMGTSYLEKLSILCELFGQNKIFQEEVVGRVKSTLGSFCKHWVFQLEYGKKTEKIHFQGRFSLKNKERLTTLVKKEGWEGFHLSETHVGNGDFDYVMKADSKVLGPWMDPENESKLMPKKTRAVIKLEENGLRPWQQKIYEMSKIYDERKIDVIYDLEGCKGKSVFKKFMKFHGEAHQIPVINNSKELLQSVMSIIKAKGERNSFIIDFPRSATQSQFAGLYAAVEDIKSGYCYDTRYRFQDLDFDEPRVFIFTNNLPPREYLSGDRWVYWRIIEDDLVRFYPKPEDYQKERKEKYFPTGGAFGLPFTPFTAVDEEPIGSGEQVTHDNMRSILELLSMKRK